MGAIVTNHALQIRKLGLGDRNSSRLHSKYGEEPGFKPTTHCCPWPHLRRPFQMASSVLKGDIYLFWGGKGSVRHGAYST